jgi:hypothetical protein
MIASTKPSSAYFVGISGADSHKSKIGTALQSERPAWSIDVEVQGDLAKPRSANCPENE